MLLSFKNLVICLRTTLSVAFESIGSKEIIWDISFSSLQDNEIVSKKQSARNK